LLSVAGAGASGDAEVAEVASQPMIGAAAPGFELKSVAGPTLGLDGFRGRYLVVHFGASW
jgi:hypothetical protein